MDFTRRAFCCLPALKRAAASRTGRAEWRQRTVGDGGQPEKLVHYAQDEFDAVYHAKLSAQALHMGVDGMGGNAEFVGDRGLLAIVKDAAHTLEFAAGKSQASAQLPPGFF